MDKEEEREEEVYKIDILKMKFIYYVLFLEEKYYLVGYLDLDNKDKFLKAFYKKEVEEVVIEDGIVEENIINIYAIERIEEIYLNVEEVFFIKIREEEIEEIEEIYKYLS